MATKTTPKRARKGREAPRKGRRRGLVAVAGVVACGAAAYGIVELRAWARTSDRFAVEHVDVQGTSRVEPKVLVRLSGVSKGDNLFEVDVDEVAANVRAHPWVARATVSQEWPRGLRVVVVEHDPIALVALGNLYYTNAEGAIVKRYAPGERADLPVITGLDRDAIEAGDSDAQRMLREAIDFLTTWAALSPRRLAEVNVDEVRGISFTRRDDGARVAIGHAPWSDRLARLERAEQALASRRVTAERIEMAGARQPHRVVVQRSNDTAAAGTRVEAKAPRPLAVTGE